MRDTDKFCIYCGQPLQARIKEMKPDEKDSEERKELEREVDKELGFLPKEALEKTKQEDIKPFLVTNYADTGKKREKEDEKRVDKKK